MAGGTCLRWISLLCTTHLCSSSGFNLDIRNGCNDPHLQEHPMNVFTSILYGCFVNDCQVRDTKIMPMMMMMMMM